MPKTKARIFVSREGTLCIEDLSLLEVNILESLGIDYHLKDTSQDRIKAKYSELKNIRIPTPLPKDKEKLIGLHNQLLEIPQRYGRGKGGKGVSIFELKREILKAQLKNCRLCGFECGGTRAENKECPILESPKCHQYFVHLGEEKEIGRTLAIELGGCNIQCKYCQKGELISPGPGGVPLDQTFWKNIKSEYTIQKFHNISFLGGNPDQSIDGILKFLESAPPWALFLPIVWHTNGYSSPDLYTILNGLVDLWVFDFKYFLDECALSLSGAPHYSKMAKDALKAILKLSKDTPVIVRHLVLPGHWDCCQKPLIEWLSGFKKDILFHPMDQYKPLWIITEHHGDLARPLNQMEYERVKNSALNSGLALTS